MAWACIALGSNMGNRLENLQTAVAFIKEKHQLLNASSLYETAPYGMTEQESFYNSAILIDTGYHPAELLTFLLEVENRMGRVRLKKWGPRIIDLDIIFYENRIIDQKKLTVPHPDYRKRAFVLKPLADIMGEFTPPGEVQSIYQLLLPLEGCNEIKMVETRWIIP